MAAPVGCRENEQNKPTLTVENKTTDAIHQAGTASPTTGEAQVIGQIAPNAQVVSGETVSAPEDKDSPDAAKTAEDKTGAVAVEMKY